MAFETFTCSDPIDPETLLNLAIRFAVNQADSGFNEYACRTSIRHLLDIYILLVGDEEDLNILKNEVDVLRAFHFEYTLASGSPSNEGDMWWEDYLPNSNLPGAFVQDLAYIKGRRSKRPLELLPLEEDEY